ncbi:hypothetical protein HBA55_16385 [Pseudomaricurvus alkylphenolicus]|uniref:DUF7931 domain-containing protein n=1 Tax=Pseudomaricurvus alkylphenolicus TaxID=1306991 RepID=UPI001422EBF9|nr:hypothetical protein [Pseudomaricurvus alkylphenolicus]NIB41183.1 hypothetical protein [Pseudomaricurvus alkylphenolicus]
METPSEVCPTLFLLHGPETFRSRLESLLNSAERSLDILSEHLDPHLFSNEAICSAISALARRHRLAEIRVMVKNPRQLVGYNHQLVRLQQRLPSRIQLRHLTTAPQDNDRCYVIADGRQLLLQHKDGDYEGFYNSDAAPEAQALLEEYHELWDRQTIDIPELRRLSL